jgi:hypothetical protein
VSKTLRSVMMLCLVAGAVSAAEAQEAMKPGDIKQDSMQHDQMKQKDMKNDNMNDTDTPADMHDKKNKKKKSNKKKSAMQDDSMGKERMKQ